MSDIDDLMSRLPIGDIAGQLGVDETTARSAVAQALPALVGGLQHQSADESSAQGIATALSAHDNDLAQGTINIDDVDTADGDKIVSHIFGDKADSVATALSDQVPAAAVDQGLIKKLLPILAPIVMSFLASKILNKGGASSTTASGGAGDLGSILGGALGGGAGGGLGSILGGVLGGGSSGGSGGGGGLGDLLGSILGGRK